MMYSFLCLPSQQFTGCANNACNFSILFKVRNSRSPKKKKGPQTGKAISKAKGDILLHTTTLAKTITEDQVDLSKIRRIKTE